MKIQAVVSINKDGKWKAIMNEEIKIEEGIPIPPMRRSSLTGLMRSMNIGDSFVWDNRSDPYVAAHRLGIKITVRKVDGRGVRVWRVL